MKKATRCGLTTAAKYCISQIVFLGSFRLQLTLSKVFASSFLRLPDCFGRSQHIASSTYNESEALASSETWKCPMLAGSLAVALKSNQFGDNPGVSIGGAQKIYNEPSAQMLKPSHSYKSSS